MFNMWYRVDCQTVASVSKDRSALKVGPSTSHRTKNYISREREKKRERQCTHNVILRGVRATNECHTIWVCVFVALGIQHAIRMRHVICGLPLSTKFFPHYLIKGTIFEKKKGTEHKICVLIFSTTSVSNSSHSTKNWGRYDKKIYVGVHVKYPLFLSDFSETWIFSTQCRKIPKYQISLKSIQWEPRCFMRTGGQAYTTKLIIALRNFANAPTIASAVKVN